MSIFVVVVVLLLCLLMLCSTAKVAELQSRTAQHSTITYIYVKIAPSSEEHKKKTNPYHNHRTNVLEAKMLNAILHGVPYRASNL